MGGASLHRDVVDESCQNTLSNAGYPGEVLRDAEGAVGLSVGDDVGGPFFPNAGQRLQLGGVSGVDIYLDYRAVGGAGGRRLGSQGLVLLPSGTGLDQVGLRSAVDAQEKAYRQEQQGGGNGQEELVQSGNFYVYPPPTDCARRPGLV